MASFVPRDADTLAERARYTSEGLTTIECLDCLATVAVRKNSEHQTAIQWTADAQDKCPRLTAKGGRRQSSYEGCAQLAASIDAAVRSGQLPVGAVHD